MISKNIMSVLIGEAKDKTCVSCAEEELDANAILAESEFFGCLEKFSILALAYKGLANASKDEERKSKLKGKSEFLASFANSCNEAHDKLYEDYKIEYIPDREDII